VTLESWIPLVTIGGTLLLVLTSLLNFSVFVRQLRASDNKQWAEGDTARILPMATRGAR